MLLFKNWIRVNWLANLMHWYSTGKRESCRLVAGAGGWRLRGEVLAGWWFGLGMVVDSDWPFAFQLVDWLAVQGGMLQCQGIGPDGEWTFV